MCSSKDPEASFSSTWVAAIVAALLLVIIASLQVEAQSYEVLYNFDNGPNGGHPYSLIRANDGSFYGTATTGGSPACFGPGNGCGVVFRFARSGNDWKAEPIYGFQGGADGAGPLGIVFGRDGSLYGVTGAGGDTSAPYCSWDGCGTVYKLTPACNGASCTWIKTELYEFHGGNDGSGPSNAVLGPDGNVYGTTSEGGGMGCYGTGCGVIYRVKHENGSWVEEIIHRFGTSLQDAVAAGLCYLTFDNGGNIYFADGSGGSYGFGAVFELLPSDSGWTEKILYSFRGGDNGTWPTQVLFDPSGNLLGATYWGGPNGVSDGGGTLFELSPTGDGWRFTQLYGFFGSYGTGGPSAKMTVDAAGNLYGMTAYDGVYNWGNVFKLGRGDGGWSYTSLHDFTGGDDGGGPEAGSLIIDADGTIYGTTINGGQNYCWEKGCGVLFRITP